MGYLRRCYRYRNQETLLAPHAAVGLAFFVLVPLPLAILWIAGAANSAPITRNGQFCPIGYYRASAYCVPLKSTTPAAVSRTTKNCPIGTYTQSDYCVTAQ